MFQRAILFSVLVLLPTIASAGWTVVFDSDRVEMEVGESRILGVHAEWRSGFSFYPFPPSSFYSDDEHVAIVEGEYPATQPASVAITAVGPGISSIQRHGDRWAVIDTSVLITVKCPATDPVKIAAPDLQTRVGQPIKLTAIAERPELLKLTWYLGRIGDTSHPLPSAAPELTFTPAVAGEHYVWVSAAGVCSNTSAQVRIEATQPRRRSVR